MPSPANKVKLGELLIDAGIITSGDLTEAIQVSRRLGVPIGQALLVSRCVTDNVLEAALEAQPLVKDGTVSRAAAVEALKKSFESGSALRNFLDLKAGAEDSQQSSKRLAELLLDSDIVNQEQLDQALMTSYSSGMPLGSALVLEGVLSPSLFPSILRIQRNIREGKVGREDGIEELKSTFLHWIKAEESLARAAEMEDAADIYSEERVSDEDEEEDEDIETASQLVYAQPAYAPSTYAKPSYPVPTAVPQPERIRVKSESECSRLYDILVHTGVLNEKDLEKALERTLEDPVASARLFQVLGLADDTVVKKVLSTHKLPGAERLLEAEARTPLPEGEDNGHAIAEVDAEREAKRQRAKAAATKVLGGIAVGAAVAGISSLFKRGK